MTLVKYNQSGLVILNQSRLVTFNQSHCEFGRLVKSNFSIEKTGKTYVTSRFDWLNLDWLNVNQSDLTRPVSEFTLSS